MKSSNHNFNNTTPAAFLTTQPKYTLRGKPRMRSPPNMAFIPLFLPSVENPASPSQEAP